MQVPLLDLVPQYKALKNEFMKVMEEVCDSQRFILGDKVVEFERLPPLTARPPTPSVLPAVRMP